ncbi:membrane protein [Rhodobacter capsulatus YW1]|nr:membrane protein [Rhodobacter capsulatus YW1]
MHEKILAKPEFKALVARRNRFSLTLTALICTVYVAYIGFAILAPAAFAAPLLGSWSVGLIAGFGVLALSFLLTGLYSYRANGEFDRMLKSVLRN